MVVDAVKDVFAVLSIAALFSAMVMRQMYHKDDLSNFIVTSIKCYLLASLTGSDIHRVLFTR